MCVLPWLENSICDESKHKDEEVEKYDHMNNFLNGPSDIPPRPANLGTKRQKYRYCSQHLHKPRVLSSLRFLMLVRKGT